MPPEGIKFQPDGTPVVLTKGMDNYMQSKIGDAWLADKFAKRLGEHGILSVVSLAPRHLAVSGWIVLTKNRVSILV